MASSLLSGLFFHHGDGDDGRDVHDDPHVVGPLRGSSGSLSTYDDDYDPSGPDRHDRWSGYDGYDSEGSFKFFNKHKDHSGHGHLHSGHGYGYHDEECCPLVIDLLCLVAIMFSIAGASLLLSRVMEIELTMTRRKRRSPSNTLVLQGKKMSIYGQLT